MNRVTIPEASHMTCPMSLSSETPWNCRSNRCMAWRFETPEYDETSLYKSYDHNAPDGSVVYSFTKDVQKRYDELMAQGYSEFTPEHQKLYPNEQRVWLRKRNVDRLGYCGIAEPKYGELEHG